MIAKTPEPPYFAVIFTSLRTETEPEEYHFMAEKMLELAHSQPGFLGYESARNEVGITVSYWTDTESIRKWKSHSEHLSAQQNGRKKWYESYKVRVCKVERDYGFEG